MQLVVGRIGKAHGIRGEVSVEVRTDDPERRFFAGSALETDRAGLGALTVAAARPHSGRLLVAFAGVADRSAAEALRGVLLVADSASCGATGEEEWWDHDLVGLAAVTVAGEHLGEVVEVLHPPGPDLLVVHRGGEEGRELLVPFVATVVPEVDVAAGRLVVDPPEGLLDLAGPA